MKIIKLVLLPLLFLWITVSMVGPYSSHLRELVQSNNTATDHQVDTEASEASQLHHHQEDGFQSWWSRQSELKENVRKTCAKYGHSLNIKVPLKEFMYDPNHKLLFCRNAKVGTTTWLSHFLQLSNSTLKANIRANDSADLHRAVPGLFRIQSGRDGTIRRLAKYSTSFSIVRHPFIRLVSAYQDKLVDHSSEMNNEVQNFEDFALSILKESRRSCRKVKKCNLNRHWRPFISRCGYCDIPYKVIAKAENFEEDRKFIGKLANVYFKPIETHISSGGSTEELAEKYFSALRLDTVKRLFHLYRVDFEMFSYSPQLYYQYARTRDDI